MLDLELAEGEVEQFKLVQRRSTPRARDAIASGAYRSVARRSGVNRGQREHKGSLSDIREKQKLSTSTPTNNLGDLPP